jgi:LacI family transcriptional regulator
MDATTLGVLTNDPNQVFQRAVIAGAREAAAQYGYRVVVDTYRDDPALAAELAGAAGVLVIADAAPNEFLRTLSGQMGKPLSLVCHQVPGSSIPTVMSNNVQGIATLFKHLVARCQRRKPVFIRGLMSQNDGREREIAFRQELIRYNMHIPETHFVRGDFDPNVAAESLRTFLRAGSPFDSILASDYIMAIAAIEVLREAGIGVPQDVSVVGFGDGVESEIAGLTTVAASIFELGVCATRQLISQIKGIRISGTTILSVRMVVRQSCGYQLAGNAEIDEDSLG